MSIVKRTIILIFCAALVLLSLAYFSSHYFYLKGFEDLERKTVEQNTHRVTDALSVKLATLDTFCQDWSSWDDTYYFAQAYNQDYIDRNLQNDTFARSDLSLILILNTGGEMVYGKAYDIINGQETALPADLLNTLSAGVLSKPGDTQPDVTCIIMLSGQPMLIASRPILTSLDEGPSTGSFITGRFLDSAVINSLAETTSLSLEMLSVQSTGEDSELDVIIESLENTGSVYIQTQKDNYIAGYTLINDINGNPAFVFKVSIPRDVYSQGSKFVTRFHFMQLFMGIVFTVAFVLLIKYLILTRLTALSNAVQVIGSKGEISSRVEIKGKDELSRLGENINSMLESLEKSEAKRQSQNEVIGHIITNTPNGVLAINDSGNITLINDAFNAMFDLKNRSVAGARIEDVPNLADIALEIKSFRNSRAISSKKELQYVRNGVNKIYIASFARLKDEELYIIYLTDISDERAQRESLYLTDRLASIGEMASGIAHELNNPLTSIIGLSEIIAREDIPENTREDIGLIKSESHRAAGIVRNLLSFARKNATVKQPANINKILMDVLKLRSYEQGVNNIKVILEMDPHLPEIMIDYSQIQQVFINVILNAEHAMVNAHAKGKLKVKTELVGGVLKVSFTDDGPGIEPQNLRRIFDPFFTTKEVGKGTGLGLSICYGIVTAHKGQIYVMSELGKGATFVIELPLNNADIKEKNQNAR